MALVIDFPRVAVPAAAPTTALTWYCDFNSVDAHGQVIAESEDGAAPRLRAGDVILLTDGEHFAHAVVTRTRAEHVLARPDWSTWRSSREVSFRAGAAHAVSLTR